MVKQCAWCRRVKDQGGLWTVSDYLPFASHGICPSCLSAEKARNRFAPCQEGKILGNPGGPVGVFPQVSASR